MSDSLIRGSKITLTIGSTSYNTKRITNAHFGQAVYKDSTPAGIIKHVGENDDWFDAEIFIKTTDIPTLRTACTPDSNGKPISQTVTVDYNDFGGSDQTMVGTGFVSDFNLDDNDAEGKAIGTIHVEFTSRPTVS